MAQEKKEIQETKQPQSYEEALKALKAEWAERRKQERKAKNASKKDEKRKEASVYVSEALEILAKVDETFAKELSPVVTRLKMFIENKHYTRNFKKEND